MKPKTKKQREIMSLVPKLTPISERQKRYAERYMFKHYAFKNGNVAYCMTCGRHLNNKELEEGKCDCCGNSVKVVETKKRKDYEVNYYAIVSKCKKYQVVRYFRVKRNSVRKFPAEYDFSEVAQEWLNEKGEIEIVARKCRAFNFYCSEMYDLGSSLEIRKNIYVGESIAYPKMNLIPAVRRNAGDNYNEIFKLKHTSVIDAFLKLLRYPHAETLFKAGQYDLFEKYGDGNFVERKWNVVKICIRRKYAVSDAGLWIDMVKAMEFCGADILNSKNVCPENLFDAHDYWINRQNFIREREKMMEKEKMAKQYEEIYKKSKGKWFAVAIEANGMSIKVLDSVSKFIDESNAMHHCVFANGYYKKKNSLILSVRENRRRIATIEYDISKFKVLQCRGVCNRVPEHYDEILSIMEDRKSMFRKIAKSA